MEYRRLGNSGIKVSEIGLGGNTFGENERQPWGIDESSSIAVIDHALEMGINYIDTSNWYGNRGRSEEIIGKAIKGKRSRVIVATKFGFTMGEGPNDSGGSRHHILQAVNDSLRRLDTDYIDLYQMHKPDPGTSMEETLRTLDDLIKAGKVRYIACSNFNAWEMNDAIWISRTRNLNSFVTVQTRFNLLDRSIEAELVPCCQANNIGLIPWGPLAGGFLTGKYSKEQTPEPGTRFAKPPPIYQDFWSDANFDKLAKLKEFAEQRGHKVGELAISWLLAKPWVSTIIAGARNLEQVSQTISATKWKLTYEETNIVDSITLSKI